MPDRKNWPKLTEKWKKKWVCGGGQIKCKINSTDAALKGQTVSSSYKPAVIENGVKIFNKKNSMYRPKVFGGIEEKFFANLLKEFFRSKRWLS